MMDTLLLKLKVGY